MSGTTTREDLKFRKSSKEIEVVQGSKWMNLVRTWCRPLPPPFVHFFFFKRFILSIDFSVNWNKLIDAQYYKTQEEIYKKRRTSLLPNNLVVPMDKIREHIHKLALNDFTGIKQQVETFRHHNNPIENRQLIPIETEQRLRTHSIDVQQIGSSVLNAKYLIVEGNLSF